MKFLRIIINYSLTWHDHIKILCNKVSKSIGIMLRVKKNVDANVSKNVVSLFNTTLLSILQHDLGNPPYTTHLITFSVRKKAVRIISLSKWNAQTKPLFVNHRI